jgi:polysaccharide biosynthesis transport protein
MTGNFAVTNAGLSPRSASVQDRWARRWSLLVVGAVLGALAGLGAARAVTAVYTSQTSILVQRGSVGDQLSASSTGINVDNEAQLMTSTVVGEEAWHLLKTNTPVATLLQNVVVTVPPNTAILTIACTDATPASAQACSAAFAQAYIDVRTAAVQTQTTAQLASLNAEIKALQTQVQQVSGQIASLTPNSPQAVLAGIQKQVLVNELSNLSSQQQNLAQPSPAPAVPISGASLPTSPSNPANLPLFLGGGALAGLLLALVVASMPGPPPRTRRPNPAVAPAS